MLGQQQNVCQTLSNHSCRCIIVVKHFFCFLIHHHLLLCNVFQEITHFVVGNVKILVIIGVVK